MTDEREETIRRLIDQAKEEGWSQEKLAEEIWQEAVEWAGGLVDYYCY